MLINQQILRQIATNVCQTMLGLEMIPLEWELDQPDLLIASIEIQGSRRWGVDLCASEQLAAMMAESMFCTERANLTKDEIHDAFGEVTNMIGGNVKAQFGEETQLSLPIVRQTYDSSVFSNHVHIRATFECCGHQLTIILRETAASLSQLSLLNDRARLCSGSDALSTLRKGV